MPNNKKNYVVECFYDCVARTHCGVVGNTIVLSGLQRSTLINMALGRLFRGAYAYRIGKERPTDGGIHWQTKMTYAGEVEVNGNKGQIVKTFDGGTYLLHKGDVVLDVMGKRIYPTTR